MVMGPAAAKATGLKKENVSVHGPSMVAGEREKERRSFFVPLQICILGLEKTRSFFKITNQLPKFLQGLDGYTPKFRLAVLFGQASPHVPPRISARGRKGGVLTPWVEQCWDPLGCEAAASWLSKQAHAPQFIKLNV